MLRDLVGNQAVFQLLERLVERDVLPQVLLLHGTEGVGKRIAAERLAIFLTDWKKGPDIVHLKPEGKAHLHPAESIQGLIHEAGMPPYSARRKVFIIEEADRMGLASSQPLLKLLEEPPPACYFLLTSSSPHAIPETIKSRAWKIAFFPIPTTDLAQHLQKACSLDEPAALELARRAHGSLGRALRLQRWSKTPPEDEEERRLYFREQLIDLAHKHPEALPQLRRAQAALDANVKGETVLESLNYHVQLQ